MSRHALVAAMIAGLTGVANADAPLAAHDQMQVSNPSSFQWKPKDTLPPGAFATLVFGDTHVGNYDFFGKFPAKYTVPMHWHTNDVMVVMMQGSMVIAREKMPDVEIKQGGFFMLPGGMKYTAHCEEECIFLAHGPKAFDIFYQNPKDDPRNKKAEPPKKKKN
jgi:hypothetical protein